MIIKIKFYLERDVIFFKEILNKLCNLFSCLQLANFHFQDSIHYIHSIHCALYYLKLYFFY